MRVTKDPSRAPRRAAARPPSTSAPSTPGSGSRPRWSGACSTTSSTGYGTDARITQHRRRRTSCGSSRSPTPTATTSATTSTRLWRKNLRDNNGDGVITPGDGVDLNRNFPTRWGYDNEGSSPNPGSETYRGPGAGSEPETQALDALFAPHHARVPRQLPLGGRAAAVRPRLAGRHAVARRRPLRGDGRQRRHRLGDPRLRPGHLRRAVHDQRRHRLAHAGGLRHARLHAGDVDVRDGVGQVRPTTRGSPRTARAGSTSPTTSA